MKPSECLRLLELGDSASPQEIKRAYRRLAQRIHPDKHGGTDLARRRFIEISNAYRTLMRAARAASEGKPVGLCRECRSFSELIKGLDGHLRCPDCTLRSTYAGRLLPLPPIVVARCAGTMLLLAIAVYLASLAVQRQSLPVAIGAFLSGFAALVTLAWTCLTIVYCTDARRKRADERGRRNDRC